MTGAGLIPLARDAAAGRAGAVHGAYAVAGLGDALASARQIRACGSAPANAGTRDARAVCAAMARLRAALAEAGFAACFSGAGVVFEDTAAAALAVVDAAVLGRNVSAAGQQEQERGDRDRPS
jgi:hypothetical protein